MDLLPINSHKDLLTAIKGQSRAYCLIYKEGSNQSECAVKNLTEAIASLKEGIIMTVNVAKVKDVHPKYNITSAPTLIYFEDEAYKNVVKGCNSADYYKNLIEESLYTAETAKDDKPQKRVTVYSTPSCSWCNTLKTHLRKHRIRFTDIDVSQDQAAAEAMVRRSGQQGVPQTDIEGEIIIGFDKNRINTLLGIQA